MRTETVNIYTFDELSDKAKEKARDWYRNEVFSGPYELEYVIDDAVNVGKLMGIDIGTVTVKLMGGETREKPSVYWSGFSSQGDGACFEGTYKYRKGAVAAVAAEWPNDPDLNRIANGLYSVQRRYFFKLKAHITHNDRYYHARSMDIRVINGDAHFGPREDAYEDVRDCMRDFADWIYRRLEDAYNYQMSDEAVDEAIAGNDYEFYEDGSRA